MGFSLNDFHIHSTASDGTLSPGTLMLRAGEAGLRCVALTDHDTTQGLVEAREAAEQIGIELVNGVEVSSQWNGHTLHIVGLGIQCDSEPLQQGLAHLRACRDQRALEMGRLLERAGVVDAYQGAMGFASGQSVTRTHFALYMVQQGFAPTARALFQRYLAAGKPGYVQGQWAELDQAVGWIRAAGGVAVLAHPARYKMTQAKLRKLLRVFQDQGGQALEAISGSHSPLDNQTMLGLAHQLGLSLSQGSDYHGPENPWIGLGRLPPLPQQEPPWWRCWPTRPD